VNGAGQPKGRHGDVGTKVEASYTQYIRSLLQALDMRSKLDISEGRVMAVLSLEDQPKYLGAMVDARFWLTVVLMYATAKNRDELRRHESALASAVDGFFGTAKQREGDLQEVSRQTYEGGCGRRTPRRWFGVIRRVFTWAWVR